MQLLVGKHFITNSYWVRENDPLNYEALQIIVNDKFTDEIESYENGTWLIRYEFDSTEDNKIIIMITAARNRFELDREQFWITAIIDETELKEYWNYELYKNKIQGGQNGIFNCSNRNKKRWVW